MGLSGPLISALASRSGFGTAISNAVARSYCVLQLSLCRSHCSGCVQVAWCRGCMRNIIVLLSCAAGSCKSYWSDCIKAAKVICEQIFVILALVIFILLVLLKTVSKSHFLALAPRSGFGAAIPVVIMYKKVSLCFFFCKSLLCVKDFV